MWNDSRTNIKFDIEHTRAHAGKSSISLLGEKIQYLCGVRSSLDASVLLYKMCLIHLHFLFQHILSMYVQMKIWCPGSGSKMKYITFIHTLKSNKL